MWILLSTPSLSSSSSALPCSPPFCSFIGQTHHAINYTRGTQSSSTSPSCQKHKGALLQCVPVWLLLRRCTVFSLLYWAIRLSFLAHACQLALVYQNTGVRGVLLLFLSVVLLPITLVVYLVCCLPSTTVSPLAHLLAPSRNGPRRDLTGRPD